MREPALVAQVFGFFLFAPSDLLRDGMGPYAVDSVDILAPQRSDGQRAAATATLSVSSGCRRTCGGERAGCLACL